MIRKSYRQSSVHEYINITKQLPSSNPIRSPTPDVHSRRERIEKTPSPHIVVDRNSLKNITNSHAKFSGTKDYKDYERLMEAKDAKIDALQKELEALVKSIRNSGLNQGLILGTNSGIDHLDQEKSKKAGAQHIQGGTVSPYHEPQPISRPQGQSVSAYEQQPNGRPQGVSGFEQNREQQPIGRPQGVSAYEPNHEQQPISRPQGVSAYEQNQNREQQPISRPQGVGAYEQNREQQPISRPQNQSVSVYEQNREPQTLNRPQSQSFHEHNRESQQMSRPQVQGVSAYEQQVVAEELPKLKALVMEKDSKMRALAEELERLNQVLKLKNHENEALIERLRGHANGLNGLDEVLKQKQQENERLNEVIRLKTTENEALQDRLKGINQSVEDSLRLKQLLQAKLQELEELKSKLPREPREDTEKLKVLASKTPMLIEEIKELNDAVSKLRREAHDNEERLIREARENEERFKREAHENEEKILVLAHEIERLQRDFRESEERNRREAHEGEERLRRETHDNEEKIRRESHENEERLRREAHENEEKVVVLAHEIERLTELLRIHGNARQNEEKLAMLAIEIERLTEIIRRLNEELNRLRPIEPQFDNLKRDFETLQEKYNNKNKALESKLKELEQLKEKCLLIDKAFTAEKEALQKEEIKLRDSLNETKQHHEREKRKSFQVVAEKESLGKTLEMISKDKEDLHKKLYENESKNIDYQSKLKMITGKYEEALVRVTVMSLELERLTDKVENEANIRRAEAEEARRDCENKLRSANERKKKELDDMKADFENENKRLLNMIKNLEEQNESLVRKHANDRSDFIAKYEKAMKETIAKNINDMNASHQQELDQVQNRIAEHQRLAEKYKQEQEKLASVLSEKHEEVSNWREKVQRLEQQRILELEELKKHLDLLKSSYVNNPSGLEFQAERLAYETNINQLKSKISALESLLKDKNSKQEVILREYESKNQELRTKIRSFENSKENELIGLREMNERLKGQFEETRERLSRTENEARRMELEMKQMQIAIGALKSELEQTRKSLELERLETSRLTSRMKDTEILYRSRGEEAIKEEKSQRQKELEIEIREMGRARDEYREKAEKNERALTELNGVLVQKIQELERIKSQYHESINNVHMLEGKLLEKLQEDEVFIS